MFPPFDPGERRSQGGATLFRPRPGAGPGADPQYLHAGRAVRRADRHPHGHRASLGPGGGGAGVRRVSRRHRRPRRAAAQGLVAVRRGARQPRRLRQFRRGARHHHVQLGARGSAQPRLDRRAGVRGVLGAAARALQRGARRDRSPAWKSNYFVGVPAPAGADHPAVADLRPGSRPALCRASRRLCCSTPRHRAA